LRNTGNLEEHPRRRLWRHLAWAKKLERRRDPGAGAEPVEIRRGLLGDPDDTHSRYVEAAVDGMIVGWPDLPNGNPAPGPKFDYKLRWFDRPAEPARDRRAGRARRDYNVMPTDLDVYAPERWVDDALFRPEVRDAYRRLLEQGWTDALRACTRANGSTRSGSISGTPSAGTPVYASIICSSVRD
jgi:exonuclease III